MPWPILAHQAPVLPLKLWRPDAFNGVALVAGSIAPDFGYLAIHVSTTATFTHSLSGQILFCLPVGLTIALVVGGFGVATAIVDRVGGRIAWLRGAGEDIRTPGGIVRAAGSVIVGSFSHVLLDELTHAGATVLFPLPRIHIGRAVIGPVGVSQLAFTFVGAVISLVLLRRLARSAPPVIVARKPGAGFLAVGVALGAAFGFVRALPYVRHPNRYFEAGPLYLFGAAAFAIACGSAIGLVATGFVLAQHDAEVRRRFLRAAVPRGSQRP